MWHVSSSEWITGSLSRHLLVWGGGAYHRGSDRPDCNGTNDIAGWHYYGDIWRAVVPLAHPTQKKRCVELIMPSVELRGLHFSYDGKQSILQGIDLGIFEPGLYCIIGPNGVGKSTLVKCFNRILEPSTGSVCLDGQDVKTIRPKEISQKIGYAPTISEDVFSMTVVEAIMIGRHNKSERLGASRDLELVYRSMKLLRIRDLANKQCKNLSAGQRQKVALARAIVRDTPILLLDEPTSNLDVKHQVYVAELLRGFAESEGKIVIMISHDLNIAAKYAHKVIMMTKPGTIHQYGIPGKVITKSNVEIVYGVECQVLAVDGHPHVILGSPIDNDDFGSTPDDPTKTSSFVGAVRKRIRLLSNKVISFFAVQSLDR